MSLPFEATFMQINSISLLLTEHVSHFRWGKNAGGRIAHVAPRFTKRDVILNETKTAGGRIAHVAPRFTKRDVTYDETKRRRQIANTAPSFLQRLEATFMQINSIYLLLT